MDLSLDEAVVLLAAEGKDRTQASKAAAILASSTKFDGPVALAMIKTLVDRRYLEVEKDKLYITRTGHSALLHAIPVVERIRAALGGVSFMVRR